MPSWNSWYNPLDNIANIARGVGRTAQKAGESITTGMASLATNNPYSHPATASMSTNLANQSNNATREVFQPVMTAGQGITNIVDWVGSGGGGATTPTGTGVLEASATANNNAVNTVVTDPYEQWGGKEAYDRTVSQLQNQADTVKSTALDAARVGARNYGRAGSSLYNTLLGNQENIDNTRVNNEMAHRQAEQGIRGMVNRGIQSGSVMLSNRNAVDSSAAERIAQAYGQLGNREMAGANQQYTDAKLEADTMQTQFNREREESLGGMSDDRQNVVDKVMSDVNTSLAALEAAAINASLPELIEIENLKAQIKNEALQMLEDQDKKFMPKLQGLGPADQATIRSQAAERLSEGRAVQNPFNFTAQAPMTLQGMGPTPGGLPIFTLPSQRNRREG